VVEGTIFNIQRFSIQDGPGIRTTVFLKGCPLRCLWCSNPESQNSFFEVTHRDMVCQKCGRCVEVCTAGAISLTGEGTEIDRKKCISCGKCIEVCVYGARRFYGEKKTVEEVYREVIRDKPFYQNSGGGVTASGGEPLSQADFVAELFKRLRETGVHTCLDTCGYADADSWEKVLPYTNLVLYDLKIMDSKAHDEWTGKPNEKILGGIKLAAESKVPVIVRIPVIPGANDSEENMKAAARFCTGIGIHEVNLLPYHRFGESKYAGLDRRYRLVDLRRPEDPELQKLAGIFETAGLICKIIE
jgi:pyruvate formate lyase activating enzyme